MKIIYPSNYINGKIMHSTNATVIPAKISTVVASAKAVIAEVNREAERFVNEHNGKERYINLQIAYLKSHNEEVDKYNSGFMVNMGFLKPKQKFVFDEEIERENLAATWDDDLPYRIKSAISMTFGDENYRRLQCFSNLDEQSDDIMYLTLEDYNLLRLTTL